MRRTFITIGVVLLVSVSSPRAAAPRLVGVVESVVDNSLQIRRAGEAPQTVTTDSSTKYTKWVTHQPWEQDTHLTRQALGVGRCVAVDRQAADGGAASMVAINMDGAGTIYDPCKSVR